MLWHIYESQTLLRERLENKRDGIRRQVPLVRERDRYMGYRPSSGTMQGKGKWRNGS